MPKRTPATARARLADYAAPDSGMAEARSRYDGRLEAVMNEIKALIAGRKPHDLTGDDAVSLMALRAKFDALLMEQKKFALTEAQNRMIDTRSV